MTASEYERRRQIIVDAYEVSLLSQRRALAAIDVLRRERTAYQLAQRG